MQCNARAVLTATSRCQCHKYLLACMHVSISLTLSSHLKRDTNAKLTVVIFYLPKRSSITPYTSTLTVIYYPLVSIHPLLNKPCLSYPPILQYARTLCRIPLPPIHQKDIKISKYQISKTKTQATPSLAFAFEIPHPHPGFWKPKKRTRKPNCDGVCPNTCTGTPVCKAWYR